MNACPRCNSRSVLQSHGSTACMACGHVLAEAVNPWRPIDALLAAEPVERKPGEDARWRRI